jgi:hypothetical protein
MWRAQGASFEEMMMLDSNHIGTWSLSGDLGPLAQTILIMLRPRQAR